MKKVLVIGSTVADIHIYLDKLPTLEEDVHPKGQKMVLGGCAFNVAAALKANEADYTLFSPVGTGVYGEFIRKETEKRGIVPVLKSEEENGCCYCLIDNEGNRTFMSLHGAEYRFKLEWFESLNMDEYDLVYVCGLEIEESTGIHIINFLKNHTDKYIVYAPGPRIGHIDREKGEEIMKMASLVHLNRREAETYCKNYSITSACDCESLARELSLYANAEVIMTNGQNPVILANGNTVEQIPVEPVKQVNGTGAGDAHIGCILAHLSLGELINNAIESANLYSREIVQNPISN